MGFATYIIIRSGIIKHAWLFRLLILNMKKESKSKKMACRHDYENAIKVGNIDYQCPLCDKLLDPCEWFFMNSFKFIDVKIEK